MHFYAQEYSKALGRTITFQDIPIEPWRVGLLERGLPVHLVNHLATMADLHRAGRYDLDVGRRAHANGARAAERAGVRQEECGDIHRIGKRSLSVCGYSHSTNLTSTRRSVRSKLLTHCCNFLELLPAPRAAFFSRLIARMLVSFC